MRANFDKALAAILQSEGGYVNNPDDNGGPTNRGVTQAVYDDWRQDHGLAKQSVKMLSRSETMAIYRSLYWSPVHGDELPSGLDYVLFDFAINSGVNRASRYLQRALGVAEDGKIGPVTIKAASAYPPAKLIDAVLDLRLAFLKQLSDFAYFGKGWMKRIDDVRARAKAMAS